MSMAAAARAATRAPGRAAARFVQTRLRSSGGKVLGEEERADENVYIKDYMPQLAGIFPHVLVDVSSIAALCIRWFPKERKKAPRKEKNHRAMDDIRESIMELQYYKENIFKSRQS